MFDITRVGFAAEGAVGQSFEIGHSFERLAHVGSQQGVVVKEGDLIEPFVELRQIEQRPGDAAAQQARAHGGDGAV